MADKESVIIGYWKARGFVHPIILMLEYLEIKYELHHHDCGPAPHFDIKNWLATKHDVLEGFDFPNLPYYQDGSFKYDKLLLFVVSGNVPTPPPLEQPRGAAVSKFPVSILSYTVPFNLSVIFLQNIVYVQ